MSARLGERAFDDTAGVVVVVDVPRGVAEERGADQQRGVGISPRRNMPRSG